jgi:O-methyltransferase
MKKFIDNILLKFGLKIIKRPILNGSGKFSIAKHSYNIVTPSANYSPWDGDSDFQAIYSVAKHNTLVDQYRMYELWELTEQVSKLDINANFIEIGVWRGGTAALIGKKLELLKSNAKFYIADTYTGVVKSTEKDLYYNDNEHNDTSLEIVEKLIEPIKINYQKLVGIFPEDTAHFIEETEKFGLCHIDVDVYQSAKDIVDWIWDRMIVGGVIVFDDYGFHTCTGITTYIHEIKHLKDRMIIHNINGHALIIKLS